MVFLGFYLVYGSIRIREVKPNRLYGIGTGILDIDNHDELESSEFKNRTKTR